MIRLAVAADLPNISMLRDSAGESPLTDPTAVTAAMVAAGIEGGLAWVWHEPEREAAGFVMVAQGEGTISALLVAAGHDGKGIGRALLRHACAALRKAGHGAARVNVPSGRAERHFQAAGWVAVGRNGEREVVFQKPL